MGALTVLAAAIERPERVAGLVLVDGKTDRATSAEFIRGVRSHYQATVHGFVDACIPEPDSEHIRRWGRQILLRAEPDAAARLLEVTADEPPDARLVQAPTLILHGENDAIVPVADARSLHARMPGSELRVIPGAGHVPTLTRPRAVVDAIDDWWSRRS